MNSTVTVSLPTETYKRLKRAAWGIGLPVQEIIQNALEQWLLSEDKEFQEELRNMTPEDREANERRLLEFQQAVLAAHSEADEDELRSERLRECFQAWFYLMDRIGKEVANDGQ